MCPFIKKIIMIRTAFYPGSFDPVTLGHVDIIRRGAQLVDRLVIGVGTHHGKKSIFSTDDRTDMLQRVCAPLRESCGCEIEVVTYDNLTIDAVKTHEASIILRGLRNGSDFDYENQLAGMNKELAPKVETVFLTSSPKCRHITATLVRQIASMGGDVSSFVPPSLVKEITDKF